VDRAVTTDLDTRITQRIGELAAARSPPASPPRPRPAAAAAPPPPSPTAKDLVARIERARQRAAAAAAASPPRRRRSVDAAPPSPARPPAVAAAPISPPRLPPPSPTAPAATQRLLDALAHLEAAKPAPSSLLAALWSGFDAPPAPRAPSPEHRSLASGGRVGDIVEPVSLLQFDAHRGRRTSRGARASPRDTVLAPPATLPEPAGGLDDDASDVELAAAENELRLLRHPLCSPN